MIRFRTAILILGLLYFILILFFILAINFGYPEWFLGVGWAISYSILCSSYLINYSEIKTQKGSKIVKAYDIFSCVFPLIIGPSLFEYCIVLKSDSKIKNTIKYTLGIVYYVILISPFYAWLLPWLGGFILLHKTEFPINMLPAVWLIVSSIVVVQIFVLVKTLMFYKKHTNEIV